MKKEKPFKIILKNIEKMMKSDKAMKKFIQELMDDIYLHGRGLKEVKWRKKK